MNVHLCGLISWEEETSSQDSKMYDDLKLFLAKQYENAEHTSY